MLRSCDEAGRAKRLFDAGEKIDVGASGAINSTRTKMRGDESGDTAMPVDFEYLANYDTCRAGRCVRCEKSHSS